MFDKEFLDKIFYLDEDGDLFFRATGKIATHNHGKYLRVWFRGSKYYAHRIIWCMTNGHWPEHDIDHRKGNGYVNKPEGLREATQSQNNANSDYGKIRGVEAHGAKFRARLHVKGNRLELGSYDTIEEAVLAYQQGADKYFGEYAYHNR